MDDKSETGDRPDAARGARGLDADREPDPFSNDPWDLEPGCVPSIGDYLAKQRQLRGISREELCKVTRIPMRSLERLEEGAFDALDDGFVRGFVRTVADALGLDPDDTLARMAEEPAPDAAASRAFASTGMLRVGMLMAALVLLLVSVGLIRTALDALPGRDEPAPIVMRRDPVRMLAESRGVSGFSATEALVPPAAERPAAPEPDAEREPVSGPVMRADLAREAAGPTQERPVPEPGTEP